MINFSENTDALEDVLIAYILYKNDDYLLMDESGSAVDTAKLIRSLQPSFFSNKINRDIIDQVKSFYNQYKNIPSFDEIKHILASKGFDYSEADYFAIDSVNLFSFTKEYLYSHIHTYLLTKTISYQFNKVTQKLSMMKPDPKNINSIFEYVRGEMSSNLEVDITRGNMGLSVYDYTAHIQNKKETTPTGMQYLDIVLGGGWEPKTLVVFFGRPKVGKSLVISNLAVRAAAGGTNVGIYSVELGDRKYMKRVGSNLFGIPYTNYNYYVDEASTLSVKEGIEKYKKEYPNAGDIHIKEAPTGSSTVYDIENYFLKLEKLNGIHYDVIFVDYVNLLRDVDNETNMYIKIKRICEGLRKIAQRNNWCIVTATQANKQNFTNDDLGLDSVAESAGLVATVDTLIGLSPFGTENNVLKMKTVANRDNGHMGSYALFKKNFDYYRLEENRTDEKDETYMIDLDTSVNEMKKQLSEEYNPNNAKAWSPGDNTAFDIQESKHEEKVHEVLKEEPSQQVIDNTVENESPVSLDVDDPLCNDSESAVYTPETYQNPDDVVEEQEIVETQNIVQAYDDNILDESYPGSADFIQNNEEEHRQDEVQKEVPVAWTPYEDVKPANVQIPPKEEIVVPEIPKNDTVEQKIAKEDNYISEYLVHSKEMTIEEHNNLINVDPGKVGMSVLSEINKTILGGQ